MDLPAARLAGRRLPLSQSCRSIKPSILCIAHLRYAAGVAGQAAASSPKWWLGSWRLLPRCIAAGFLRRCTGHRPLRQDTRFARAA